MNDDGFGIPNPNNRVQVDAKYKGGRDSANHIAVERHQDVGESPHGDSREKANDVERQQDAEVALENLKEEGVKQERDQDGANDGGEGKCFNYNIISRVLPSIPEACRPNKPSVQNFL